jgi:hypothetical protein
VDKAFIEEYKEKGLPDIKKEWHGGHLNQYWYIVRDSKLFWPWYNSVIDGIMDLRPQLDETQLQDEVTELIRSESNWISAMTGSLNASTNMEIDVKTTVCYRKNHPLSQSPNQKNNFSELQLDDEIKNWSKNLKTIV